MTENNITIQEPNNKQVENYLKNWKDLENYSLQEGALNKLFFNLCPKNEDISDILLKVSTLNDFYSTNIFSTFDMAKHIKKLKIDEQLEKGNVSLVNKLAEVNINGKAKNFYSFATKYCSHHKPDEYPIYDGYVNKVLYYFQKKDNFLEESKNLSQKSFTEKLKNYKSFKEVIEKFREHYELGQFSLKEIDQYLWQLGKEKFPKKY